MRPLRRKVFTLLATLILSNPTFAKNTQTLKRNFGSCLINLNYNTDQFERVDEKKGTLKGPTSLVSRESGDSLTVSYSNYSQEVSERVEDLLLMGTFKNKTYLNLRAYKESCILKRANLEFEKQLKKLSLADCFSTQWRYIMGNRQKINQMKFRCVNKATKGFTVISVDPKTKLYFFTEITDSEKGRTLHNHFCIGTVGVLTVSISYSSFSPEEFKKVEWNIIANK